MTIITAFPIMLMIVIGAWGIMKELNHDHLFQETLKNHQSSIQFEKATITWREHLGQMLKTPKESKASVFNKNEATDALTERKKGRPF